MSIELVTKFHKPGFLSWLESDESSKKFVSRSDLSCSRSDELFERILSMTQQHGFFAWVKFNDNGEIIAYAELKESSKVGDGELELIYVVSEEWRNKGIATDLVGEIILGRASGNNQKLVAYVGAVNWASRKVLLNNRFLETPSSFGGIRYEYRVSA